MAISNISKPNDLEPAFKADSLTWTFEDGFDYTSVSDDGGFLEVDLSSGFVGDLTAGEKIYISSLSNYDLIDYAVVEIKEVKSSSVVVDVAWDSGFSSIGTARKMKKKTFDVLTGYTGIGKQPRRKIKVQVRPDGSGVYTIRPFSYVVSRFNFEGEITSELYYHNVYVDVFEEGGSPGNNVVALASLSSTPAQGLIYLDSSNQNKVNLIESDKYNYVDDMGDLSQASPGAFTENIHRNKTYEVLFDNPLNDADTTITPTPQSTDWIELITSSSGQVIDGFKIINIDDFPGTTVTFDDTVGGNDYEFTFTVFDNLGTRQECEGVDVMWWHPDGGWVRYIFSDGYTEGTSEGEAQLQEKRNEITPVDYDDIQDFVTVRMRPESETIYDYLNTLNQSIQIFVKKPGEGSYSRHYLEQTGGREKRKKPFKAANNRLEFTFVKSQINRRIHV